MLQAIWFIIRLGLLVFAVAWVIEHPGTVVINIEPYEIKTSTAVLIFAFVFIAVIFALLYRFYRAFISVPANVRKYKKAKNKENGYLAVTKGLAAVAAGDKNTALKHANRAKKLLPDAALTSLLSAQAALLNNDSTTAQREFEALLDDKEASFFGIRGIINLANKEQDSEKFAYIMQKAEELAPKQSWISEQLFEFQARNHDWNKAEQSLMKAVKLKAINRKDAAKHRQAILIAKAIEAEKQGFLSQALNFAKKAYKIDINFIPATITYARLLHEGNKNRHAIKVIEKTWSNFQHPELVELWLEIMPPIKRKNAELDVKKEYEYQWAYRLYKLVPFGKISNDMMGSAAMKAGKLNEAREFFKLSGNYKKLAKLEIEDGNNETKARKWLEMASDKQEKQNWVCLSCGYISKNWEAVCDSCSAFNQFEWTMPQNHYQGYFKNSNLSYRNNSTSPVLEPPNVA